MLKSGLTSGRIIPGALIRSEEVGVLMLRGGLGRHGVPAASTVATGSSPFLAFQRVGSTNLTNIHLLPERKTNGGLENGGVGAFMALRCGACIGAPLRAVNPDWDTFTGFKEVTKMEGGQPGGREVTELLS